jgi:hypothetical protein
VLLSAEMLVTSRPGQQITDDEERNELMRRKRIALASLPSERYPNIIASAAYLTDCDAPEDYFERGFDTIVAGVRAQASGQPEPPGGVQPPVLPL